jgi:hypothetical protein
MGGMKQIVAASKAQQDDPAGVEPKLHKPRRIEPRTRPAGRAVENWSPRLGEDQSDKDRSSRTSDFVQPAASKRIVESRIIPKGKGSGVLAR